MALNKTDMLDALNSVTSIPVIPFRGGEIDYEAHGKNIDYLMQNNHLLTKVYLRMKLLSLW